MDDTTDLTDGSDEVRIIIQLPQPLDKVSKVLSIFGTHWPHAKVDTSTPGGWTILIPPEDQ